MAVAQTDDEVEARRQQVVAKLTGLAKAIDKMYELRERKRALDAEVKEIEEDIEIITAHVLKMMDAQGVESTRTTKATASISKVFTGNVTDWEKFYAFIKRTSYFHLLQRRLSDASIRELFETKGKIPGVEPFEKRRINLRALKP